ncbi:hypothetical protein A2876_04760 [Candidatus Amesbacteria bacterium RIFCSPHIGHO2_01_FULL_48_32b]|uniref:tRNA-dihydrouridine synthase n=1 Tax=Candidatus Amesbacteria bacterium RIFCSPHIGHO2_01_FULL_48_32b TaxID=1797253 RepID=A0A1F4YH30_9BACT|nr:MAG: hypothetical protein A2876_04760 [Candidatus Amesbacteria bacterium RIFCSPHIGHO2_01_FULL_48_32b]
MSFWQRLTKPFWVLAPMEDVTDSVFRRMVISVGRPDVCFTEFTNIDSIIHAFNTSPLTPLLNSGEGNKRREVLSSVPALQRLVFSEIERPIVAQIWGVDPEKFYEAGQIIKKMGFDGVDINLGCPVKDVVKIGACAAMIGNTSRVAEIIAAVRESGLPVSVKTRIGYDRIITEEWIDFLLGQKLAVITIHGRTAREMSKVSNRWEEIGKAVAIRDGLMHVTNPSSSAFPSDGTPSVRFVSYAFAGRTLIIGNGDVKSVEQAEEMVEKYGVDGVMIGRGVLENIGCFREFSNRNYQFTKIERTELLKKHLRMWGETWGENKNFSVLKKYVKVYVRDFEGSREMREKLVAAKDYSGLVSLVDSYQM